MNSSGKSKQTRPPERKRRVKEGRVKREGDAEIYKEVLDQATGDQCRRGRGDNMSAAEVGGQEGHVRTMMVIMTMMGIPSKPAG